MSKLRPFDRIRVPVETGCVNNQSRRGTSLTQCSLLLVLLLASALSGTASSASREKERRASPVELSGPAGTDIAFNNDGARLLAAGGDSARVWDVRTAHPLGPPLRHAENRELLLAALSPDGKRVLTVAGDEARLWEATTGQQQMRVDHKSPIWSAAISPDWARLVTAGEDGAARVWDTSTGGEVAARLHPQPVRFAAFTPDGRGVITIAAAGERKVTRDWENNSARAAAYLWDHATGRDLIPWWAVDDLWVREPDDTAAAARRRWRHPVAFTGGGRALATLKDGNVTVRDTENGWVRFTTDLDVPYGGAGGVTFSPDGRIIATIGGGVGADDLGRVWDASTGKLLRTMDGSYEANDLAFSPDSKWVLLPATWDDRSTPPALGTGVWDASSGRQVLAARTAAGANVNGGRAVAFSTTGKQFAVSDRAGRTVTIWDVPAAPAR